MEVCQDQHWHPMQCLHLHGLLFIPRCDDLLHLPPRSPLLPSYLLLRSEEGNDPFFHSQL